MNLPPLLPLIQGDQGSAPCKSSQQLDHLRPMKGMKSKQGGSGKFGSVLVTVGAWDGSSGSGFRFLSGKAVFLFQCYLNRKGQLWFRLRFLKSGSNGSSSSFGFWEKRFRRFRFPVPVRFLGHPVKRSKPQVMILLQSTSYSGSINYRLQLQQWPLPLLMKVTTPGGIPRAQSLPWLIAVTVFNSGGMNQQLPYRVGPF